MRGRTLVAAAAAALLGGALAAEAQPAPEPAPPPGTLPGAAVVWAVGDGADGGRAARRLAARIARDRPDRFLYLGDVYERGTAREFARNYHPVYGSLAGVTAPTPGNHEWANRRSGYNRYWRARTGRAQRPWYRLRAGGWEIVSLSSEAPHGAGSAQLRWLRAQVDAPGTCRLAFWHRPRHSAGRAHGDAPDVAPLWNALRGRAALVLNGHEHNLQRLRPRDGLVELVAGAGGRSRYPLDRRDRRLAFGRDDVDGALRLELAPGVARFAFVASSGRVLDRGQVACRAG